MEGGRGGEGAQSKGWLAGLCLKVGPKVCVPKMAPIVPSVKFPFSALKFMVSANALRGGMGGNNNAKST